MYRKKRAGAVQKSCQGGGGGVFGHVFPIHSKTPKNFVKCLIFNGLTLWSSLWSSFGVVLEWLENP